MEEFTPSIRKVADELRKLQASPIMQKIAADLRKLQASAAVRDLQQIGESPPPIVLPTDEVPRVDLAAAIRTDEARKNANFAKAVRDAFEPLLTQLAPTDEAAKNAALAKAIRDALKPLLAHKNANLAKVVHDALEPFLGQLGPAVAKAVRDLLEPVQSTHIETLINPLLRRS